MKYRPLFFFLIAWMHCQSPVTPFNASTQQSNTPKRKVIADSIHSIPIVSYEADAKKLTFFLKNEDNVYFNNIGNLKTYLMKKNSQLKFAMNGGMYLEDFSPQGLYIENTQTVQKINLKRNSYGNFYLQPNGIFQIDKKGLASIVKTSRFQNMGNILHATQSGPILLMDGKIHPAFRADSKSLYIRNGVGILPNGNPLFAISLKPINLYHFALFFKRLKCRQALYLDGAISKMYLPDKGIEQLNGNFGVIIAETE